MVRCVSGRGFCGYGKWMEVGCSVRRRVQVSQVRDDGGLDTAVAWSHLEGTFLKTG